MLVEGTLKTLMKLRKVSSSPVCVYNISLASGVSPRFSKLELSPTADTARLERIQQKGARSRAVLLKRRCYPDRLRGKGEKAKAASKRKSLAMTWQCCFSLKFG